MDSINLVLSALFAAMAVWMLYGYFKTRKYITIYDRTWSASRILFLVAGVAAICTIVMYSSWMDYLRIGTMAAAILGFLLMRDGIGEQGIVSAGKFLPWVKIKNYDCYPVKKRFTAAFSCNDSTEKKKDVYMAYIDFDDKNKDAVEKILKEKIGNKHLRMKRGS